MMVAIMTGVILGFLAWGFQAIERGEEIQRLHAEVASIDTTVMLARAQERQIWELVAICGPDSMWSLGGGAIGVRFGTRSMMIVGWNGLAR
jgi:hypothetical protein